MRLNAKIVIKHNTPLDLFYIFLSGYGDQNHVRDLMRRAVRGIRREIIHDAERFIIRLIRNAKGEVTIFPESAASHYTYHYHLDLTERPPTIRVWKPNSKLSKTQMLFRWLGNERQIKLTPEKPGAHYGKRRRGRPSVQDTDPRLRGFKVPAPDWVDETGPHWHDGREKRDK